MSSMLTLAGKIKPPFGRPWCFLVNRSVAVIDACSMVRVASLLVGPSGMGERASGRCSESKGKEHCDSFHCDSPKNEKRGVLAAPVMKFLDR